MTAQDTGRYNVGHTYCFIEVQYERKEESFFPLYIPGKDELKAINLHMATCKEHHKVHEEWDPKKELKCDGYIFETPHSTDETKTHTWHCQYPQAHYGQMDDSMDYKILLSSEIEDPITSSERLLWGIPQIERYLENILRSINPNGAFTIKDDDDLVKGLAQHAEEVMSLYQEKTGIELIIHQWVVTRRDTDELLETNILKVSSGSGRGTRWEIKDGVLQIAEIENV